MENRELRDYIDRLRAEGYTVRDDHGEDPDLIDINGKAVDTWRENYPYHHRMHRNSYEVEKYLLQIELLKFQNWSVDNKKRHLIIFEGRDAAGKGGTIKRFNEYINVRHARVVALTKPTEREKNQWYFQRYIEHLPSAGEIVMFDRSWYNRANVERVMGFLGAFLTFNTCIVGPFLANMVVFGHERSVWCNIRDLFILCVTFVLAVLGTLKAILP